jgi:hypothetical protein
VGRGGATREGQRRRWQQGGFGRELARGERRNGWRVAMRLMDACGRKGWVGPRLGKWPRVRPAANMLLPKKKLATWNLYDGPKSATKSVEMNH